mgnify:FL=1
MTKIKLVVFDMDGTLLHPRSCWAYIHEHFGTDNTEMLKLYIERKISDKEFVKADFKLWQSSTKETVNEKYINSILDEIEPIEGAGELIDALHEMGIITVIISGGIQYLADKWARKWNMEKALANEIIDDENGSLKAIIHVRGNTKGPVMESLLSEMKINQNEVISVGDTVVDLPLFERSLFSIAVNTEDTRVIEKVNYHHRSKNLSELIPVISKVAKH